LILYNILLNYRKKKGKILVRINFEYEFLPTSHQKSVALGRAQTTTHHKVNRITARFFIRREK